MSRLSTDCLYCIDQVTPAGIDPVLGPVFVRCHSCVTPCPRCGGNAAYPALSGYFELLIEALDALGFGVELCRSCLGVIAIVTLPDGEDPT
jgi:hypothetical protein